MLTGIREAIGIDLQYSMVWKSSCVVSASSGPSPTMIGRGDAAATA